MSSGNALFSLIGFMGLYALLSVLYLLITIRIVAWGPDPVETVGAIGASGSEVEGA